MAENKPENKRTWGQLFFDLTSGKGHQLTKAGGTTAILGGVGYTLVTGDINGLAISAGGAIVRFRDQIKKFLDTLDMQSDLKEQPKETKVPEGVKPALRATIGPEVVKKAMDEACVKLNGGKDLTAADQVALAVGASL